MNKKEILKNIAVNKLDENTVFIKNRYFNFSYFKADSIVKDEYKGQYRYFGGLQSEYHEDSPEFKSLEKWLIELSELILKF